MEAPATILNLLAGGESARLEFKAAGADLETLGQAICAFLNSGGGQIVVGVRDDGGLDQSVEASAIEAILRPLSGGAEPGGLITPSAVWDVSEEFLESGRVAIIDVPAGVDLPYVFRDSIYVRVGTQMRLATGSETRALIDRRYLQGARWERQPILEVGLDDLDHGQIFETARVAAMKRGWRFRDPEDAAAVLEDLNLMVQGRLTHAAVVLFAKQAGKILTQAKVRATVYHTDKSGAVVSDDQLFEGHIFANVIAFEAFIQRHVAVVSELSASQTVREDRPVYPYWALREGFRNALMHRDYSAYHGQVAVSVYPGRIDIWSYGGLPAGLTPAMLKTGDRSLPVNPDIAQVMFLRGLVELLGRGTRKIVEEFRSRGLPEPAWRKQSGGITLALRAGQSPDELPKELNVRQIDLLRRMRPGALIDVAKHRESSAGELAERTARNDLLRLLNLGFLVRQGQGRSTFYVRTEKPIA